MTIHELSGSEQRCFRPPDKLLLNPDGTVDSKQADEIDRQLAHYRPVVDRDFDARTSRSLQLRMIPVEEAEAELGRRLRILQAMYENCLRELKERMP